MTNNPLNVKRQCDNRVPARVARRCAKGRSGWASGAWAAALIVGSTAWVGPVFAQSHGPLTTSEQNPLYRWLGTYPAEPADGVEGDRIGLATSYSNLFETGSGPGYYHLFDFEQMVNTLELRVRLRDDLEVGGGVSVITTWGGFLDGFVTDFHDFFGFPNGGRGQRPEGEHSLLLGVDPNVAPAGGDVSLDLGRSSFDLEDIRAHVKWRVAGGRYRAATLSLHGTVRALAGPFDPGRLDVAGAVLGRYSSGPFHFHGQLGASTLSPPDEIVSISKESAIFYSGAVEAALTPGFSVLAQLGGSTEYVVDLGPGALRDTPLNLVVGFAGGSMEGWTWEASFAEDVLARGPSVDFTVDVGVSRSF